METNPSQPHNYHTPKLWNEIDALISVKNCEKINSLLKNDSDRNEYYDSLIKILFNFEEHTYSNLKLLINMNISKETENFLISLIPYLFYLYLWGTNLPQGQSSDCCPLVDILIVDLHTRFVLNQDLSKYSVEKYIKNLDEYNAKVLPNNIKIEMPKKTDYIDFEQRYTSIFQELQELYSRSYIRMIPDSRLFLLAVVCCICGFFCEPKDIQENKEFISNIRMQKEKGLPSVGGISINPRLQSSQLFSQKTQDDFAYNRKKDLEFVFKALKGKAYNDCRFKGSWTADKVEESMLGQSQFDLL